MFSHVYPREGEGVGSVSLGGGWQCISGARSLSGPRFFLRGYGISGLMMSLPGVSRG